MSAEKHQFFTTQLLQWASQHNRLLPWKNSSNPYHIWLSEVILQQTRVEQGLPYYSKFIEHYPTVFDLANATEDQVLKDWEGLGYYTRARNLHAAAKYIARELDGKFPDTYKEILKLKGVGPYTAAAIASFAFQLPHAVVDGNVYRVLSRFFGINIPIDTTAGKKLFAELAQQLLDQSQPAIYNQAIMDFGATWCTPKQAKCLQCPLRSNCFAFQMNNVNQYPVKQKKVTKRIRYFNYLILNQSSQVWIEKRTQKDIWKGLYQFPLIELIKPAEDVSTIIDAPFWQQYFQHPMPKLLEISPPIRQTLTHQYIVATFWEFQLDHTFSSLKHNFKLVERSKLSNYAFPKIIDCYLKDNSLYLGLY